MTFKVDKSKISCYINNESKDRKDNYLNKTILTDVDGVLLNLEASFTTWMAQNGHNKIDADEYDVATAYGIDKDYGKSLVKSFNNSAWMGHLPALRDARSGVAKLVEAGYDFQVITSLSLDKYAKKARVKNLQNIFGKDVFTSKNVTCLDTGADKDEALAPYKDSGLYWVEDKTANAVLGADMGLSTLLINHGHNQSCKDSRITRVANWTEICNIILD